MINELITFIAFVIIFSFIALFLLGNIIATAIHIKELKKKQNENPKQQQN